MFFCQKVAGVPKKPFRNRAEFGTIARKRLTLNGHEISFMTPDTAQAIALKGAAFIFSEDALRDRFLSLSGTDGSDIRARIEDADFQASLLDFLISFEPDLIACAEHIGEKPETLVAAWRALGGGAGQEW